MSASSISSTGEVGDALLNDIVMQVITTFTKEYSEKRQTTMSMVT